MYIYIHKYIYIYIYIYVYIDVLIISVCFLLIYLHEGFWFQTELRPTGLLRVKGSEDRGRGSQVERA